MAPQRQGEGVSAGREAFKEVGPHEPRNLAASAGHVVDELLLLSSQLDVFVDVGAEVVARQDQRVDGI